MKNHDLTKGNVHEVFLKFFFPMLFTNILQQAYSFADTVIVGKGIGEHALASVGNVSTVILFVTGFIMGMTNGFGVVVANRYGEGSLTKTGKAVASSFKISAVLTAVLTVLSILLLKPMLLLMHTDSVLVGECLKYGYIIAEGIAITFAYNLFSSVLRATGDSKTPFTAILISSVTNILLDCIFVFYLKTGVGGAAVATVVSQGISAVICFVKIRKSGLICMKSFKIKTDSKDSRELLKNGIPMACMNSVTSAGCMIVQSFVNSLGVVYTSAYSACNKYINLFMLPSLTAGFTLSSFTGQNMGAKKYERIKSGVHVGIITAVVSYVFTAVPSVFFPEFLAGIMLSESNTIAAASQFLRICGGSFLLLNLVFIYRSTVQGMGKPFAPMCSGISEMIARIMVIFIFLGTYGFNVTAFAEITAWITAFIINYTAYRYFIKAVKK